MCVGFWLSRVRQESFRDLIGLLTCGGLQEFSWGRVISGRGSQLPRVFLQRFASHSIKVRGVWTVAQALAGFLACQNSLEVLLSIQ